MSDQPKTPWKNGNYISDMNNTTIIKVHVYQGVRITVEIKNRSPKFSHIESRILLSFYKNVNNQIDVCPVLKGKKDGLFWLLLLIFIET